MRILKRSGKTHPCPKSASAIASGYATFPVLDAERRTIGILSKTDLLKKVDRW